MAPRTLIAGMVPLTLWDSSSETLFLPAALAQAYVDLIAASGLAEIANARDADEGPVGGLTKESADAHLAQAFDGSVARVMLAVLDPTDKVGPTSDTFIRCTSGATVCLTDAPCGAGAATLALLCSVAELRAQGVLPREPLDVRLVAAELSPYARQYAEELVTKLQPVLEEQAIFIVPKFLEWDVTDELSTVDLIKKSEAAATNSMTRLLVVANFNGFLEREKKRKEAEPQLKELFQYASGEGSYAVWIEPAMNAATNSGGLLPWLHSRFATFWRAFGKARGDEPMYTSKARFRLPLAPTQTARVHLAVLPIELKRNP
jgi:hypothetical protein